MLAVDGIKGRTLKIARHFTHNHTKNARSVNAHANHVLPVVYFPTTSTSTSTSTTTAIFTNFHNNTNARKAFVPNSNTVSSSSYASASVSTLAASSSSSSSSSAAAASMPAFMYSSSSWSSIPLSTKMELMPEIPLSLSTSTTTPLVPDVTEMKSMLTSALNYVVKDLSVPTNGLVLPSGDKNNAVKGIGYKWIHENNETELMNAFGVYNAFQEPIPEQGCGDFEGLLDKFFKSLYNCSLNDNSPGYMAWIPSGAMYASCVADFISSCSNRFVSAFMNAPSLQAIEDVVIRWFLSMIGMSDLVNAGGILTGGGSMANFQAIHAARCHYLKKDEDILKLTVYVSEQSHYCVDQGVQMCGIPVSNIRHVPTHSDFTIKTDVLEQLIQEDIAKGYIPMMAVAVAGTTNTGSVDNIDKVCDICDKYGLWKHVDGAYGGFFALTQRGSQLLKGIERADSVVLDPHKSFFLPYGTGCLLVRNKNTLLKANKATGAYMHEPYSLDGMPNDLSDMGPELSRRFRGLGVWLPVKMYGMEVFRKELELKLDLTQWAVSQIGAIPYIKIMTQPKLTIFAFRLECDQVDEETKERMNRDLLDNVNKRGNIVLSAIRSRVKRESNEKGKGVDAFCLRMVILSQRTQFEHVRQAVEDIKDATAEVMQTYGK